MIDWKRNKYDKPRWKRQWGRGKDARWVKIAEKWKGKVAKTIPMLNSNNLEQNGKDTIVFFDVNKHLAKVSITITQSKAYCLPALILSMCSQNKERIKNVWLGQAVTWVEFPSPLLSCPIPLNHFREAKITRVGQYIIPDECQSQSVFL